MKARPLTKFSNFRTKVMGRVVGNDARAIPLEDESIELIHTNPPYVGAIDYVRAFRLERYVLGLTSDDAKIRKDFIGEDRVDVDGFYQDMKRAFGEMARVLKPNGFCIVRMANVVLLKQKQSIVDKFTEMFASFGLNYKSQVVDKISDETRTLFFANRKHEGYIGEDYQLIYQKG